MQQIAAAGEPSRKVISASAAANPAPRIQRIPGGFQMILALYILFTGALPTIIQAFAFGIQGGTGSEFAVAMITAMTRDVLLLAAVAVLAGNPLGILHPLLLAVVVWPLLVGMPNVIQDFGGWAGIIAGLPVRTPFLRGLPSHSASMVWTATAKYSALQILALICTYAGFALYKGRASLARRAPSLPRVSSIRSVMLGLIAVSTIVLLIFVRSRGGIIEHLTSLGHGRFRELGNAGAIMVITDLGSIALYVWLAVRPGEIKSPFFLACAAVVIVAQFVSNASRSSTLEVPLVLGLIWSIRTQKVPWKIALMLVPVLFVALGFLGAIRSSSWSGSTAAEAAVNTGWTESFKKADAEIADRQSLNAQVPIVERGFQVTDGPLLGRSYIGAVLGVIPRSVWPDKPRGPDSLYAQLFLHESKEGAAIPVSHEAEIYWNFGVAGVVLLSLLYGAMIRAAYNSFWRRYPSPFAIVFYVVFITTFQFSTTGIVAFEQSLGLLLICYLAAGFFTSRSREPVARPLVRPAGIAIAPR